jgi:predicted DNA-binding protein with PD1-like motif
VARCGGIAVRAFPQKFYSHFLPFLTMQYSEAKSGRVFVLRLEDGDVVHECLEQFAHKHGIERASFIAVGGADKGSVLVVGPEDGRTSPIVAMTHELYDVHEICGTGTIFPDDSGRPMVHAHFACGREENTVTGCIRSGVKVWHIMEIVLTELLDNHASRKTDAATGFKLLAME